MTLIFTEGFDHQSKPSDMLAQFGVVTGVTGFATGRFGGQAAVLAQTFTNPVLMLERFLPLGLNGGTLGFAFCFTPAPPAPSLQLPGIIKVGFGDLASSHQFTVTLNPSGFVAVGTQVPLGASGTSQTAMYQVGTWAYCEIGGVMDTVNGSITVKINGVNAVSVAGVKTSSDASTLSNINWLYNRNFNGSPTALIDDVYFCDMNGAAPYNTFLGGCHINTILPTANGTYSTFTPSSPNNANWQSVHETILDGDSTYNTSSNVGNKDTFVATTAFTSSDVILAIQTKVAVRKDDTVDRQMQTYLKSGITEVGGASYDLTQAYLYMADVYVNDPATQASWTAGGVNALEFGYNILV
jgi:hypothetical protein